MKASARHILDDYRQSLARRRAERQGLRTAQPDYDAPGADVPDRPLPADGDIVPWHPMDDNGMPALPSRWTPEHVVTRLIHAYEIARTYAPVGPKAVRGQQIAYRYTFDDVAGWLHEGDDSWRNRTFEAWGRKRARPPAEELALAEEAGRWPLRYLPAESGAARMLRLWLKCKISGRSFGSQLARRKIAESTGHSKRRRALDLIVAGLERDGIPVR